MKLNRLIKTTLKRLSGDRVFFESSSDLGEVKALIRSLAPVAINRPLVRLGSATDGGYLVPDDLKGLSASVSPGVSTEVGFDLDMAERGMAIYMADASVQGPPIENPHFHFHKKFLDVVEGPRSMRLDTLCSDIKPEHAGDRVLQMDIEGAEYPVLIDASDEVLRSFRIMIIEFHSLDRIMSPFALKMINAIFQKLRRSHHIVHIHPNNCSRPVVVGDIVIPPVMEFTFYRKDRAKLEPNRKLHFPHRLDRDNVPDNPGLTLPECWQ